MLRLIGFLVVCLLVVGGLGLYLGWFGLSFSNDPKKPDVHLTVNKDKIEQDVKTIKDKVENYLGEKTVKGTIQQVEPVSQMLNILDDKKQAVVLKVDSTTKIKIGDMDGSLADLKADDPVTVMFEAKKDGNVARTITVAKKS